MIDVLIKMATDLDKRGLYSEASKVDFLIKKLSEKEEKSDLSDKQKDKMDVDNDNDIDAEDLKALREKRKAKAARKSRIIRKVSSKRDIPLSLKDSDISHINLQKKFSEGKDEFIFKVLKCCYEASMAAQEYEKRSPGYSSNSIIKYSVTDGFLAGFSFDPRYKFTDDVFGSDLVTNINEARAQLDMSKVSEKAFRILSDNGAAGITKDSVYKILKG